MAQLLAGRYELGTRLGVGGMAEVVRGFDTRLQRPVAVKLIPTDRVDEAARERFRREARASARFSHPHAVTTYDAGEAAGRFYLVMELVEGPTLSQHLTAVGRLDAEDAVRIADAVLDALGAAHDAGLVHRDVKPSNVLLGTDGTVKLADFGIARQMDEVSHDLTATGTFIGTARYAAPEQLAGRPATARSDLYAVGVVLYEVLAGRPPFDGDSAVAIAMAHHHEPVPDVRVAAPGVPRAVATAISRALAKDPADRFESAAAMRAALDARTAVAPLVPPAAVLPASVAAAAPTRRLEPAAVGGSAHRPRRPQRWWWLAASVLALAFVGTVVALARDQPPTAGSATTTAPAVAPAATTVPAAAPPTTSSSPTGGSDPAPATPTPTPPATVVPVAPTAGADEVAPSSVDELAALIGADLDRYGPKAPQVVAELQRLDEGGRGDAKRARQLLERSSTWAAEGQLDPAVPQLLEPVLGPLAERDDNGDGGGGKEGDG
jgi:serine/threonine-protein kinase